MTRKGQITLESLLLYGVAILVVLLAVGALTYFGILDLGRLLPDRCNLASAGTISCEEWAVVKDGPDSTTGDVLLGIRNVGPKALNITDATYTPDGSDETCTFDDTNSENHDNVRSGEIATVAMECGGETLYQSAGQKTRGDLVITFQFRDGALENPVGGQLIASVS